jgi:hypothetical protein
MNMKDKRKALEEQLAESHDWTCREPHYSGIGNELVCTDVCRICGLEKHTSTHHLTRWHDSETGQDLTLRQAAARGCVEE